MKIKFLVLFVLISLLVIQTTNAEIIRYLVDQAPGEGPVRFPMEEYQYSFIGNLVIAVGLGIDPQDGEIVRVETSEKHREVLIGEYIIIFFSGPAIQRPKAVKFFFRAFRPGVLKIHSLILCQGTLFSGVDKMWISPPSTTAAPSRLLAEPKRQIATSWGAMKKGAP